MVQSIDLPDGSESSVSSTVSTITVFPSLNDGLVGEPPVYNWVGCTVVERRTKLGNLRVQLVEIFLMLRT
ncbi:hypothetical protein [Mycolicibacterium monacense]|uniref:hypothetical protein n=1 Tax=Mycolicibacterium monacense TaxID=85693 RepID=UPI0007EB9D2E|nr:hypothetical protein [Mycolicibacterium monacense]OBF46885.1 hypothetical protein A5778_25415 [Mycolicibacterium monacense]